MDVDEPVRKPVKLVGHVEKTSHTTTAFELFQPTEVRGVSVCVTILISSYRRQRDSSFSSNYQTASLSRHSLLPLLLPLLPPQRKWTLMKQPNHPLKYVIVCFISYFLPLGNRNCIRWFNGCSRWSYRSLTHTQIRKSKVRIVLTTF